MDGDALLRAHGLDGIIPVPVGTLCDRLGVQTYTGEDVPASGLVPEASFWTYVRASRGVSAGDCADFFRVSVGLLDNRMRAF